MIHRLGKCVFFQKLFIDLHAMYTNLYKLECSIIPILMFKMF